MPSKFVLNTAIRAAFGSAMLFPSFVSAAVIADGHYTLKIIPAPSSCEYQCNYYQGGYWKSTFSINKLKPTTTGQPLTDNGVIVSTPGGKRGSSIAGDGFVGSIGLAVSGGSVVLAGNYQLDAILGTTIGDIAQYGLAAGGVGTIDQLTGAMTLIPTGRYAASSAIGGAWFDRRWNVPPSLSGWNVFTTGTQSTSSSNSTSPGSITGTPLTPIGDINADGLGDYHLVLVSSGTIGSDWGALEGKSYIETWDAMLVSTVPVPAAVWLLGSGLLTLFGVVRLGQNRKLA